MDTSTSLSHSHPDPHPNPQHHRKIELQSPQDLLYLQTNLAASARQKLDLHFPPSSAQPETVIFLDGIPSRSQAQPNPTNAPPPTDPLRERVQSLIDHFLHQTWSSAAQNISVNGLDATALPTQPHSTPFEPGQGDGEREGVDFAYDAYDTRLSSQVADLHAEVEALTTQVARLRREAPRSAARRYEAQLRQVLDEEEGQVGEIERVRLEYETKGLELDPVPEGWRKEVGGMYERGVEELRRLGGLKGQREWGDGRGSLTETMGKVQRARTVMMELN